jgi:hypothetical protein
MGADTQVRPYRAGIVEADLGVRLGRMNEPQPKATTAAVSSRRPLAYLPPVFGFPTMGGGLHRQGVRGRRAFF